MSDKDVLESIREDISEIKVTLAKQHVSLDEHIRRTELLEKSQDQLRNEIKPIQKHVAQVDGVLKFFGLLATAGSLIYTILEIVKFFN